MKKPTLQVMRGMLSAQIKEIIDNTPHIDLRPDFRATKANVIVLHGLREHMYSWPFHDLIESLFRANYHVISIDFPNHGANVRDERLRGMVNGFWRCIDVVRVFSYWVLLSQKWGTRPTFIVGYSFGSLVTMRLLETKFLLRKGVAGAIFISPPLRVDHNASEQAKRWIPFIKPLRSVVKRMKPRHPVSPPNVVPEDPLHDNKPVALRTAIEIFDATNAVNKPGQIERLRELGYVAFFHGKRDATAPIKDSYEGFCRIVGSEIEQYEKTRHHAHVKCIAAPNGSRMFVQYDSIGHNIFEDSPQLIPDVVALLDRWVKTAKVEDVFVDDHIFPIYDLFAFGWLLLVRGVRRLWEAKYQFRRLQKTIIRKFTGKNDH